MACNRGLWLFVIFCYQTKSHVTMTAGKLSLKVIIYRGNNWNFTKPVITKAKVTKVYFITVIKKLQGDFKNVPNYSLKVTV